MIDVRHLSLHYPGASAPTLRDLSFRVRPGELAVVCGPTGCGKSSLLNCLNGTLLHESTVRFDGDVLLDGRSLREFSLADTCRLAGTVFQDPRSQICTATPETEIAFGLENLAIPRPSMAARIDEALAVTGLAGCRHQATGSLSGGQQQRLALACALAIQPRLLLLDEPISQLDPGGAREILAVIDRLKHRHDLAIVLVEHRLEEVLPLADRVLLLRNGELAADLPRETLLRDLSPLRQAGLNLPHLPDLFERLGHAERPLSVADAPLLPVRRQPAPVAPTPGPVLCRLRGLRFAYGRQAPLILDGLDLELRAGERVALMGRNGTGKSTLLHLLAGTRQPTGGTLTWEGGAPVTGLMVQNPDLMLFCETVAEEAAFSPTQRGLPPGRIAALTAQALARLGLTHLAGEAPFALSRGQRLRTAVASIVTQQPRVLLLDEPTTGQDRLHVDALMSQLETACDLVVFCTHDVATAARHATRLVLLEGGRVAADGPPRSVLYEGGLLASDAVRVTSLHAYAARLGVPALAVDDLLECLRP